MSDPLENSIEAIPDKLFYKCESALLLFRVNQEQKNQNNTLRQNYTVCLFLHLDVNMTLFLGRE